MAGDWSRTLETLDLDAIVTVANGDARCETEAETAALSAERTGPALASACVLPVKAATSKGGR